jgi:hypothetical protein
MRRLFFLPKVEATPVHGANSSVNRAGQVGYGKSAQDFMGKNVRQGRGVLSCPKNQVRVTEKTARGRLLGQSPLRQTKIK